MRLAGLLPNADGWRSLQSPELARHWFELYASRQDDLVRGCDEPGIGVGYLECRLDALGDRRKRKAVRGPLGYCFPLSSDRLPLFDFRIESGRLDNDINRHKRASFRERSASVSALKIWSEPLSQ
jgi:hypothetical protein